jgi:glutamate-1-semialdehyde 2,1-aminomutase
VPPFLVRGSGTRVWDVDGHSYLDLAMAYGCLIHGHAAPGLSAALVSQAARSVHLGAPAPEEVQLARIFRRFVPSAERVLFATEGSPAVLLALRLARAASGRRGVLRFEGHYHGAQGPPRSSDFVAPGRPLPPPPSGGPSASHQTWLDHALGDSVTVPFNAPDHLERAVREGRDQLGAILLEPVMANAGVIPPDPEFLAQVREIADSYGLVLVYDEMVTGFRVAPGGAQELYRSPADLSCWGKALGGGLPLSAISGRADLFGPLEKEGMPYGGTYAANSLALAAGRATLEGFGPDPGATIARLSEITRQLHAGIEAVARDRRVPLVVQSVPGILQFYFTEQPRVRNYAEALRADSARYQRCAQRLLLDGVLLHPDQLERIALSTVHEKRDTEELLARLDGVLAGPR